MLRRIIAALLLAALGTAAIGFLNARQAPVAVRSYRIGMADWPDARPPLRLAFLSDTHVGSVSTPPSRLTRIVAQVNALAPDCVLLGGDYIFGDPAERLGARERAAVAPFAALRPRIASFAVSGNHDAPPRRNASAAALMGALAGTGVRVLDNQAAKCGPLTITGAQHYQPGGLSFAPVTRAAQRLGTPLLLLTHSPNAFDWSTTAAFRLVVAGHTHCGQIALPVFGAIWLPGVPFSRACGLIQESGRVLIVGPGIGTSGLPLRLFTRPEILLIEVGPIRDS